MYFDPGTGSIIIQFVLAVVATIGATFLAFKSKIIGFFKKKSKEKKNDK